MASANYTGANWGEGTNRFLRKWHHDQVKVNKGASPKAHSHSNIDTRAARSQVTYVAQPQRDHLVPEQSESISAPVHDVELGQHTCIAMKTDKFID